jgi:hypothetical protein
MKYCIPAPTILNQHKEEFSRCRTFCQIGADPDMEKTVLKQSPSLYSSKGTL